MPCDLCKHARAYRPVTADRFRAIELILLFSFACSLFLVLAVDDQPEVEDTKVKRSASSKEQFAQRRTDLSKIGVNQNPQKIHVSPLTFAQTLLITQAGPAVIFERTTWLGRKQNRTCTVPEVKV